METDATLDKSQHESKIKFRGRVMVSGPIVKSYRRHPDPWFDYIIDI